MKEIMAEQQNVLLRGFNHKEKHLTATIKSLEDQNESQETQIFELTIQNKKIEELESEVRRQAGWLDQKKAESKRMINTYSEILRNLEEDKLPYSDFD